MGKFIYDFFDYIKTLLVTFEGILYELKTLR